MAKRRTTFFKAFCLHRSREIGPSHCSTCGMSSSSVQPFCNTPLCTAFGLPLCTSYYPVAHLNISCLMCTNFHISSSPQPAVPVPAGNNTSWLSLTNHTHSTFLTNQPVKSKLGELLNQSRTILESTFFYSCHNVEKENHTPFCYREQKLLSTSLL